MIALCPFLLNCYFHKSINATVSISDVHTGTKEKMKCISCPNNLWYIVFCMQACVEDNECVNSGPWIDEHRVSKGEFIP